MSERFVELDFVEKIKTMTAFSKLLDRYYEELQLSGLPDRLVYDLVLDMQNALMGQPAGCINTTDTGCHCDCHGGQR